MKIDKREQYRKALDFIEDLYPSAQVLAAVQQTARNADASMDDLVALIKQDASMTADIIRLSNSAFYGYATHSKELYTAVNRVGMQELLKLVGLSSSKATAHQKLAHYRLDADAYWFESVFVALMMEFVCERIHLDAQEAYTVGLFSLIGKMVINQAFEFLGESYEYDGSSSLREWETSILGFDHAYAGAMLLKRWEFPVDIISPIMYQFEPERDVDNFEYVAALHFIRSLMPDNGFENLDYRLTFPEEVSDFMEKHGLSQEVVEEGFTRVMERLSTLKSDLGC